MVIGEVSGGRSKALTLGFSSPRSIGVRGLESSYSMISVSIVVVSCGWLWGESDS